MKVVLVANDKNPTDMMKAVAKELEARGHRVVLIIGENPGECLVTLEQVGEAVDADVVFVGMSSSEQLADPELEVLTQALA
ncbi:MAG: hypothetical protein WC250_03920, partial [Candidatus Paceibacterota bacterium]